MVANSEHPTEIILNMINVIVPSVSRPKAASVQQVKNNHDTESNKRRYRKDWP